MTYKVNVKTKMNSFSGGKYNVKKEQSITTPTPKLTQTRVDVPKTGGVNTQTVNPTATSITLKE